MPVTRIEITELLSGLISSEVLLKFLAEKYPGTDIWAMIKK